MSETISIIEEYRARAVAAERHAQVVTNTLIAVLLATKSKLPLTVSKNTLNQVPKHRVVTEAKGRAGAFTIELKPVEGDSDA